MDLLPGIFCRYPFLSSLNYEIDGSFVCLSYVLTKCFIINFLATSCLQLPRILNGDIILDLVVIGCGPAGLALAAESAKLGLNVGLIGPDLPFTNNYGVWEDEFKGNHLDVIPCILLGSLKLHIIESCDPI